MNRFSLIIVAGLATLGSSASASALACDPADFDLSGQVELADLSAFMSAYFAGNMLADTNASGEVSVQDLFDFLTCWLAHFQPADPRDRVLEPTRAEHDLDTTPGEPGTSTERWIPQPI